MITRVSDFFRRRAGWCPHGRAIRTEKMVCTAPEKPAVRGTLQQPESGREKLLSRQDMVIALAVVILIATNFLGGFVWWPIVVAIVLAIAIGISIHPHHAEGRLG